jgi:hypothetical protein
MSAEELEAYLAAHGIAPSGIAAWTQMVTRKANAMRGRSHCQCLSHCGGCYGFGIEYEDDPVVYHAFLSHPDSIFVDQAYDVDNVVVECNPFCGQ